MVTGAPLPAVTAKVGMPVSDQPDEARLASLTAMRCRELLDRGVAVVECPPSAGVRTEAVMGEASWLLIGDRPAQTAHGAADTPDTADTPLQRGVDKLKSGSWP